MLGAARSAVLSHRDGARDHRRRPERVPPFGRAARREAAFGSGLRYARFFRDTGPYFCMRLEVLIQNTHTMRRYERGIASGGATLRAAAT